MLLSKKNLCTVRDIYSLPEGRRAELIDGVIYDMAPPSRMHQRIVTEVSTEINRHIRSSAGDCEVDVAPFAVFLDEDEYTYVEPDISVICDREKLTDRGCEGAPDWVIEVVSRSSMEMDYYIKLLKYRKAGVRVYWIIDPSRRAVRVYNFMNEDETADFSFDELIPAAIYPGFGIRISDFI